jgi:FKBP-type peptidyl-prolyl cis-trans isomerase 2
VVCSLPDGSQAPGAAMPSHIEPGMRVRHPDRPDWGDGQVQSVIGDRVTVNFPEAGKVLINAAVVDLTILEDDRPGHG